MVVTKTITVNGEQVTVPATICKTGPKPRQQTMKARGRQTSDLKLVTKEG